MVNKEGIIRIAKKRKLPLGTIEKDFILCYILDKIYNSHLKSKLIFKGGTALHKLFLHKRMSIDLDFTELKPIKISELKKLVENKEINSKIKDINETATSTKILLGYRSVLEYKNNIIIDISKREKPILELMTKPLRSPYFEDIKILTFQLEELIAEKIRALIQRNKPRDYLDIFYILNKKNCDLKKAIELSKQKLKNENDQFNMAKIFNNLEIVQNLWLQDLSEISPKIPRFDNTINKIKKEFKKYVQ